MKIVIVVAGSSGSSWESLAMRLISPDACSRGAA